eukprot:g63775.t1
MIDKPSAIIRMYLTLQHSFWSIDSQTHIYTRVSINLACAVSLCVVRYADIFHVLYSNFLSPELQVSIRELNAVQTSEGYIILYNNCIVRASFTIVLRRDYCKRGKSYICVSEFIYSGIIFAAIQLQLSCRSLRTNRNTRQTALSSNNPSKRQNHHKPRFSSMYTPSDSDFDDYYDEVAQDLFSEEMESVKKLEQERAIEKNEDEEDENEEEDEEEGEEEGEEEEEEEEEEREEPGSERKEGRLSKVDDFILDTAIVAAALGTNGRLGYWSLSELSDKDFEKGEICAERCCRISKPKVGRAPQRMKTLRWKHEFFLAQKGSESMPTLLVCFYNEKEEKKFWDWMKAEDFDSSAWRLTLTAEAKDENIEQKEAPRLRRNNQRRLKREVRTRLERFER